MKTTQLKRIYRLAAVWGMAMGISLPSSPHAEQAAEGVALFRTGQYAEAREWFSKYLSLYPTDPTAHYYLGRCESDGNRAQEHFREILKRYPRHELADDALFAIAQSRYAGGYYKTARGQYERLLREYPRSNLTDRALYQIGLTLLATKEPGAAMRRFREVRRRYPNSEWVALSAVGRVDAYVLDGDDRAALALCDSLLMGKTPMKSHLLWTAAQCYERVGRRDHAAEMATRTVDECPSSYEAGLARNLLQTFRTAPADSLPASEYTVQVGAFRNITNATNLYNQLVTMALNVRVESKMVQGRPFYVVLAGPYRTQAEAENVATSVRRSTETQPQVKRIRKGTEAGD